MGQGPQKPILEILDKQLCELHPRDVKRLDEFAGIYPCAIERTEPADWVQQEVVPNGLGGYHCRKQCFPVVGSNRSPDFFVGNQRTVAGATTVESERVPMGLPGSYRDHLAIDERNLVLLPSEEPINIRSIDRGILFIMANWSGASQLAFRAVNTALASLPDLNGLHLYVADTDSEQTQRLFAELGDVPAGVGETYWVLNGRVQHTLSRYDHKSLSVLREYTQQILTANCRLPPQDAER